MTKEEFDQLKARVASHSTYDSCFLKIDVVPKLIAAVENAHPEWTERSVTLSQADWMKLGAAWNYYTKPTSLPPPNDPIATALAEVTQ